MALAFPYLLPGCKTFRTWLIWTFGKQAIADARVSPQAGSPQYFDIFSPQVGCAPLEWNFVSKMAIENPWFTEDVFLCFPIKSLHVWGISYRHACLVEGAPPSRYFEQDPKGEKSEKTTEVSTVSTQRGRTNICRYLVLRCSLHMA